MSKRSISQSKKTRRAPFKPLDKPLFILIVILGSLGLIAVFNSSSVLALRDFGDQFYYVRDQSVFFGLGILLMGLITRIHYKHWYALSIPLLVLTLILLLAVFIPGIGITALGAKRWLDLGLFTVQPTEIAKLALVIYLSAWFTYKEKGRFLSFMILLGLVVGLVILQPDLGTAVIILSMAIGLYFVSGGPLAHFLILLPIALMGVALIAIAAPYRLSRIMTFFNPDRDPLGASYHVRQVLIALGSGGLLGVGVGKSRQKYEYLPEANTDSIFAVIAEEVGFVGAVLLIALFLAIIYRAFLISRRAPDRFGMLLASGVGIWFSIQVLINLASMAVLIPLTGVPLPLISYGGSNLITMLIGFGILLNISRHAKK